MSVESHALAEVDRLVFRLLNEAREYAAVGAEDIALHEEDVAEEVLAIANAGNAEERKLNARRETYFHLNRSVLHDLKKGRIGKKDYIKTMDELFDKLNKM